MARILSLAALALVLAAPAQAGPGMLIGAAEDHAKTADLVTAKAKMDLAALAGFDAIRMTAIWSPGRTEPDAGELASLESAAAGANLVGIRIVLSVYHKGSKTTPLSPADRAAFASYTAVLAQRLPSIRDFIIGNEPNLNLFWMPQFTASGKSASPAAYLALLAQTYDALKAVDRDVNVIGGSVSPRGGDNPRSSRHTHSPTRFIRELGKAYRATRRALPIMDSFAFHPYGESSSTPPTFERHPRSTSIGLAEYDRLVALLGEAFDGTGQLGSTLPIVYDEYGVDTVPPPAKMAAYTGREPSTTRPVSEAVQSRYYRTALAMAYCQPNVQAILLFHVADEPDLDRWQSGVFYADDTPKASLQTVRTSIAQTRAGTVARCGTWKQARRWIEVHQGWRRPAAKASASKR